MSNLVQSLLESANPYTSQMGVTQKLAKKWAKSGLLEGLKDYDRNNMAMILENQAKQLVMEESSTGGGVTNGATFTPGNGEQYAMGSKKISRKKLGEDAPRLAGGKKANISTYTADGFTKAPSAEEAAKSIKGVDVKDLWGKKALEENYSKFRNETRTRGKSEQFHEAVKIINKKLDEVNKLLEFTGTLKTELSESEDTFEVKTYTKKSMDKVRGKVIEAYQKLKQL